jgi:hypothetical protein
MERFLRTLDRRLGGRNLDEAKPESLARLWTPGRCRPERPRTGIVWRSTVRLCGFINCRASLVLLMSGFCGAHCGFPFSLGVWSRGGCGLSQVVGLMGKMPPAFWPNRRHWKGLHTTWRKNDRQRGQDEKQRRLDRRSGQLAASACWRR